MTTRSKETILSQKKLKELFFYDCKNGDFIRLKPEIGRKVGSVAVEEIEPEDVQNDFEEAALIKNIAKQRMNK